VQIYIFTLKLGYICDITYNYPLITHFYDTTIILFSTPPNKQYSSLWTTTTCCRVLAHNACNIADMPMVHVLNYNIAYIAAAKTFVNMKQITISALNKHQVFEL